MEPLISHLVELIRFAPEDSFLLAGGLGLMIKRAHLMSHNIVTLATSAGHEIPEARATTDIDIFLRIEMFVTPEKGLALRRAIDSLGYTERNRQWQFDKPLFPNEDGHRIILDLLARLPTTNENVQVKAPRVGSSSRANLHGHLTPEAFAVEEGAELIDVLTGNTVEARVPTAHPYSMLNMKIRAASDWNRFQQIPWQLRPEQSPPSGKHAFDAALIVAMLTEAELSESREMALRWRTNEIGSAIRTEAFDLFGHPTSPGWIAARRQGMFDDHDLIWTAMRQTLGIA